jgi:glycosyltransferase involved in cell wall biosynthesis
MEASSDLERPPHAARSAAPPANGAAARRPMIFLVSHSSAGGAQQIWSNLAEGFHERGEDVQLMALYPFRSTVRETPPDLPWTYVVDKRPTTPFAIIGMIRALITRLKAAGDVTVFTAMPAANVLAPVAAKLAGGRARVVISHHTPVDTYNPVLNRIDSVAGALSTTTAVVSVSEAVSDSCAAKPAGYRAKRKTIYNALPPKIETLLKVLADRYAPRVARGRKVVATGRLAPQKNYALLVEAARHMPDVTVDIAGNGPLEAELKALARDKGVNDRVHFLGHMPREEAMEVLAAGDVFAQVSLFEGHSLGLIEAAKLGLPLVVSDVPVQIEGITARDGTRCGIAVAPDDAEGLAREIRRLLDDPVHYAEWAGRAKRLGEEATYSAMLDAYAELVA